MRPVPGLLVPIRKLFAERTARQHLGLGLICRVFEKWLEPDFRLLIVPLSGRAFRNSISCV